jgi:hypothetical protein
MQPRRWSVSVFLIWILAPTLGACSNERHFEWTEDVKLSDGRMMVIKRTENYRRILDVGAGFQQGWLLQKSSISAELPSPIQRKISWEGSLFPLVLDIQSDNSAYLVCTPSSGAARTEWKVPDHEFYIAFRLKQEGWQRIPLADLPTLVQPNLVPSGYGLFIRREIQSGIHVDLKMKTELNSDPNLSKRLKSIVRLPAPNTKNK